MCIPPESAGLTRRLPAGLECAAMEGETRMSFAGPDDLNRFVSQVRSELDGLGLHTAAERLGAVQDSAFTTGSEWLGELGSAVRQIQRECTLPETLDGMLERIMREVRRVWPAL
jgi:hypothetical protein